MTRGFLYTAFGDRYVAEARQSAASLRKAGNTEKICLITDGNVEPGAEFDIVLPITAASANESYAPLDSGAYYRKIEQFMRSPFERTLYIDSDTFITQPLNGIFDLLGRFDLMVTLDGNAEVNYRFEQVAPPFSDIPKEFGCFNTGVLAYRKSPATELFFRQWCDNYEKLVKPHTVNDQPALRYTLYHSDLRYHVLPVIFNWFSWIPNYIPSGGKVAIMHGRNPWLFRWARHFTAETSTIVGAISLKLQFLHFAGRFLHWLSRHKIIPGPKL